MCFAKSLVLDQLDVPIGILLTRRLIHDHPYTGVLGTLQDRLERLTVVRHHADYVDLLGDEILDGAYLLGWIVGCRINNRCVDAEVLAGLQRALLNIVEPRDLHLAHDTNLGRIAGGRRSCLGERRCDAERRGALHESATCYVTHLNSSLVQSGQTTPSRSIRPTQEAGQALLSFPGNAERKKRCPPQSRLACWPRYGQGERPSRLQPRPGPLLR